MTWSHIQIKKLDEQVISYDSFASHTVNILHEYFNRSMYLVFVFVFEEDDIGTASGLFINFFPFYVCTPIVPGHTSDNN